MQLQLIPPQSEYAEIFFEWRNQASSKKHNPLMPFDLEGCRANLLKQGHDLKELWDKESFRWFIKMEKRWVGHVSLKSISQMMLTAEIGYGISEEFQGQGIGTNAVALLVQKVFDESPLRKLIAMVHDQNTPSRKLLENLGFQQEGVLREHFIINGNAETEILFGLLRKEWKRR